MKNICFFNSIKFWGGGEKLQLENALEFKKKNYNVILLAHPNSPLWEKARSEKMQTFPVTAGNLSFLNPFKLLKLVRFYKRENIDTVVFTTSQDVKLGGIAAKWAKVKNIVYLRGLALPIKADLVNRYVFNSVLTHIISNSEETKRSILKHLGKYIPVNKVHTIYHGIIVNEENGMKAEKLEQIQKTGHGVILGNAGRLTAQKGQEKLIRVAKKIKEQGIDFTLFIAGTGELQSELQQKINENNLQNDVILLGFVEDMDRFMSSIDIFLLSSAWEGFGFVLVEAMVKSKPVVAFNISSNGEIVDDNITGFLADYPDLYMFAEKIIRLIKEESLRTKMGEEGVKAVHRRFILEDRVSEIEKYLLESKN